MRNLLILLLASLLFGCAEVNLAEKPQTFAGCAALDVATTAYAVHMGVAHETNPLLAVSVNAHHFLPMVLSKFAIVGLVWWLYDMYKDSQAAKAGVGVATVVTCGVAIHNATLIMK